MDKRKTAAVLALALSFLMTMLTACGPERQEPEPSPSAADSGPVDSPAPQDSGCVGSEPGTEDILVVHGQSWEATRYESELGYTLDYPPELVTLNSWAGGETYQVTQAEGTYLAVSLYAGANIDQAVDRLQFDYAIEEEPTGAMFGSAGYAGVRMSLQTDILSQEYILFQDGEDIFLIELAIFAGNEGQEGLLQAMLDTFTIL